MILLPISLVIYRAEQLFESHLRNNRRIFLEVVFAVVYLGYVIAKYYIEIAESNIYIWIIITPSLLWFFFWNRWRFNRI
jgi:uncharacterized membrane protein